jgi:hypothetical protein
MLRLTPREQAAILALCLALLTGAMVQHVRMAHKLPAQIEGK